MTALAEPFSLDKCEAVMARMLEPVDCPVSHTFTPGLYLRTIYMRAGSLITSKIHRTMHQFIISMGRVSVLIEGGEVEHLEAPYIGTTMPGTRRLLYIHSDCVWTTCHVAEETSVEEIEARIIEPHENPFMDLQIQDFMAQIQEAA